MINPVFISSFSSISAMGFTESDVVKSYQNDAHFISRKEFLDKKEYVSTLTSRVEEKLSAILHSNSKYRHLDRSVLMAIVASREAIKRAGWSKDSNFGINIGSSRGATALFEKYHSQFIKDKNVSSLSSPTTTLGNISSWVAQDLQNNGPEISHSITCSTSLHSLLNGIAWINSGMCNQFLVGGSEAPLTPFTIEQMKALRLYALKDDKFPNRASDLNKTTNTMVLGESAVSICLENTQTSNSVAKIIGVGYATEILKNNTSISAKAKCFQKSMKQALGQYSPSDIDIIVTHTPGTIKGDKAELSAINEIFRNNLPAMTNNKWKIGHTLGASGLMSVDMALLMLKQQEFYKVPFVKTIAPKCIEKIMINSVGFGGNAVSVVLEIC